MKTQLFSIALELAVGVASFHPGSLEAQNALYFGPPRNLGNLNTSLWDYSGSMTEDGLEIFFISTGVKDENDIWTAKRTSVIDASGIPVPFEEKRNLEEVNTAGFESYSFISPDGLVLY